MKRKSNTAGKKDLDKMPKIDKVNGVANHQGPVAEPSKRDVKPCSASCKTSGEVASCTLSQSKRRLLEPKKMQKKTKKLKNTPDQCVTSEGPSHSSTPREPEASSAHASGSTGSSQDRGGEESDEHVSMDSSQPSGVEETETPASTDPYLLADTSLCKESLLDHRWTNRQRTLVFSSRGISHRHRHLIEDIKKMLPHSKSEPKWEKNTSLIEINEICEMQSCNNCIFFESRKGTELYMWLSRVPNGPSARFQVLNIHTLGELKMTGNCLLHSRPLLVFDKAFNTRLELQVLRELFTQAWGTPRNHPKTKPFHDHVMSFVYHDNKIWFRHYQISPMTPADADKPERQLLTEIGPRFVLDPIKIFDASFSGATLYHNPHYVTPTALRLSISRGIGNKYAARKASQHQHQLLIASLKTGKDLLDRSNVFAATTATSTTDKATDTPS